jgi:hypothetical protein
MISETDSEAAGHGVDEHIPQQILRVTSSQTTQCVLFLCDGRSAELEFTLQDTCVCVLGGHFAELDFTPQDTCVCAWWALCRIGVHPPRYLCVTCVRVCVCVCVLCVSLCVCVCVCVCRRFFTESPVFRIARCEAKSRFSFGGSQD